MGMISDWKHPALAKLSKKMLTRLWLFAPFLILILSQRVAQSAQALSICQVQGSSKTTPYAGDLVQTEGVVTADFGDQSERGFFIQAENCDGLDTTSDGIFVYVGDMVDVVDVGDQVAVDGIAEEDFGLTRINATPTGVGIVSSGNPPPQAVDFSPPLDNLQSDTYFEARESMLVHAADTIVVGPTDARDWGSTGFSITTLPGQER
jgi:predicted extracellular nuclease